MLLHSWLESCMARNDEIIFIISLEKVCFMYSLSLTLNVRLVVQIINPGNNDAYLNTGKAH